VSESKSKKRREKRFQLSRSYAMLKQESNIFLPFQFAFKTTFMGNELIQINFLSFIKMHKTQNIECCNIGFLNSTFTIVKFEIGSTRA